MITHPFKGMSKPLIKSSEPISKKPPYRTTVFNLFSVGLLMQVIIFSGRVLAEPVENEPWEFIVTPYLWGTSIDGNSTVRGQAGSVDVNASDVCVD